MARFGQGLIEGLRNPTYGQGLFNLGASAGSYGGRRRQEEKERDVMTQVQQALGSNNPDQIDAVAKAMMSVDPNQAILLTQKANQMRDAAQLQSAQGGVAYLNTQMQQVLKDKTLDPVAQQKKLQNLQEAANAIGAGVKGLDPMAISNLSMAAENAVFQQDERVKQSKRADDQLTISFERLGLARETAAIAADKHKEWMATANYRTSMRTLQKESQLYDNAAKVARGFVGQKGGKEKFIAAVGDEKFSGLYDALENENKIRKAQLDQIEQNIEEGKFKFTDDEIRKHLGLGDDEDVTPIRDMAKANPKTANKFMMAKIQQKYADASPPDKAYVTMFMNLANEQAGDYLKWESAEEKQRQALRMAGAAAAAYAKTGDMAKALEAMTGAKAGAAEGEAKPKDPTEAALQELQKMVSAQQKQQQDAIDY